MEYDPKAEEKIQALLDSKTTANIELAFSLLQNLELSEVFARYLAFHFPIKCLEHEVALAQISQIEEINCAFSKITYLPENLGHFKKLRRFELECNRIKEIPASIGDLKQLEYISFYDCDPAVEYVDPAIGQLQNLKELLLGVNQIKKLPETLYNCSTLQCLDLSENPISILSEKIQNLQQLEWLDLNFSKLKALPKGLLRLKKLRTLLLDNLSLYEDLELIGAIQSLERLSLYDWDLKEFPEAILNLKNLRRLDLSGNQITSVPKAFKELKHLEIAIITSLDHDQAEEIMREMPNLELYYDVEPMSSIIYSDGK